MSYLSWPRLHFAGRFQADTSTVNNDVRHYDNARFRPRFQLPMASQDATWRLNGYWNPEGTAAFRLIGCRVTGASLKPGELLTTPAQDGAIGLHIGGSTDRVAGKLVDLDPQQQGCSQIWGLKVNLERGTQCLMGSRFEVSPLYDLWKRQQIMESFDQTLAAAYQSTLADVAWADALDSAVLDAMRAASADGLLSIRFNVFGYDRAPEAEDYTTGVVVGTIGPASATGPKRFTIGRQLIPKLAGVSAVHKLGFAQAVVDAGQGHVALDLGNSLPIEHARGDLEDLGELSVAVLRDPATPYSETPLAADAVQILGPVPYTDPDWYFRTAGIVEAPVAGAESLIADHPLAVVQTQSDGTYMLMLRETADGQYARADQFVFRLDAGEAGTVDVYSSRYGVPTDLLLNVQPDNDMLGGAGTNAKFFPPIPVPEVGTPEAAIGVGAPTSTGEPGHQCFTLTAAAGGPGNPRGYLDGQVYGFSPGLADPPPNYLVSPWNFVSVLAFDAYPIPERPTWYDDIQPIMTQYGNLYPIMSRHLVDLGDYHSVVAHRDILVLSFALDVADPNSMPVSRDLSRNKRAAILKWLTTSDPATGLPYRGTPPVTRAAPAEQVEQVASSDVQAGRLDAGGKMDFITQVLARRRAGRED